MVIDTSALLAIIQDEPERRAFNEAIEAAATSGSPRGLGPASVDVLSQGMPPALCLDAGPESGSDPRLRENGRSALMGRFLSSTVARMLPRCSSMWLRRSPPASCSALIGGMPARTGPLRSRAASSSPRTIAAAEAAFCLCRASVSAFVQLAYSCACLAFISSSMAMVKCGMA
jgi:hypothetical protein